ncbi:hypothetical protein [Nannocystis pusilla]|uniref:hypothetical protein n=1 Tax=Nannocystis pusilla TaxID=889268 RepID=UPI003B7FD32B
MYINGQIDTAPIEEAVAAHGLSQHLFLFRCPDQADPSLDRRLVALFDVKERARVLARFERELEGYLHAPGIDGDEVARRWLAAGPAHYRVTFVDEPALPARCLPADYPLERLIPTPSRPASGRGRSSITGGGSTPERRGRITRGGCSSRCEEADETRGSVNATCTIATGMAALSREREGGRASRRTAPSGPGLTGRGSAGAKRG